MTFARATGRPGAIPTVMQQQQTGALEGYGTPEGVKKSWDVRGRGRRRKMAKELVTMRKTNRAAYLKQREGLKDELVKRRTVRSLTKAGYGQESISKVPHYQMGKRELKRETGRTKIGSNMSVVQVGPHEVFYSYSTPVAMLTKGGKLLVTNRKFSNTTTRQIGKYARLKGWPKTQEIPQEYLNKFVKSRR